jgi:hypothetical protein
MGVPFMWAFVMRTPQRMPELRRAESFGGVEMTKKPRKICGDVNAPPTVPLRAVAVHERQYANGRFRLEGNK